MRPDGKSSGFSARTSLGDFLNFDRIIAGEVLRMVYWAGLGIIVLIAFGSVGASVGVSIKDFPKGVLLAIPTLVVGLLVAAALALIWRAFCEFFAAILRISDDLHALRVAKEAELRNPRQF